MMLGLSTLGLRVFDVLRGYDYVRTRADVSAVHVHGVGTAALFGYFAAALEPGFASVTVEEMLYSYRNLCETRYYDQRRYGLPTMAWGILRHFDLVDLLACLRGRPVRLVTPRDASGRPVSRSQFNRTFLAVAKANGCFRGGWRPEYSIAS